MDKVDKFFSGIKVNLLYDRTRDLSYNRLRVRDINDAIRELGQMVAVHTGTSASTFTKLTVLQEAVRVITELENRLRGTGAERET